MSNLSASFETIVQSLQANFMFNASLASKELFHSNMISWLLTQVGSRGKGEVYSAFCQAFDLPDIQVDLADAVQVERETKHFDLLIRQGIDGVPIVIENKLKSLVSKDQLKKYAVNAPAKNSKLIVLMLFDGGEGLIGDWDAKSDNNWEVRTYETHVLRFLNELRKVEFENKELNGFVIPEYIAMIEQLLELTKHFGLRKSDQEFVQEKYVYGKWDDVSMLRKIKMHDLVLKHYHSRLDHLMRQRLAGYQSVDFEVNFTNGSGLNSIKLAAKDPSDNSEIWIGIQLQAGQLRQFVIGKGKNFKKRAQRLVAEQLWFVNHDSHRQVLDGNGRKGGHSVPIHPEDNNSRNFCQYSNGTFLYLYKAIDQDALVESVIETIENWMLRASEIRNQINQGVFS